MKRHTLFTGLTAIIAIFAMFSTSATAIAGAPLKMDNIEKNISKNLLRLSPQLQVKSVRAFDAIPGLYEVHVRDTVFYTDAEGRYLISGHVIETATKKDLTQSSIEDLNRMDWSTLPLKNAVVSGDPEGTPVAIFTDPDCPYCRQLEQELPKVKGIKFYTFLFPLVSIHKDARAKAIAIWCAKDQHKALQDVMLHNKQAGDLKSTVCNNPIDDNLKLAESLGISGTPTLIAKDGRKHAGGFSAEQLMEWAKQAK
ncbi:MAG: DsbC family protein [Mariprofundaceae bacterium]|nr:DsbC family protein [Mariprofundaceae bacterium]